MPTDTEARIELARLDERLDGLRVALDEHRTASRERAERIEAKLDALAARGAIVVQPEALSAALRGLSKAALALLTGAGVLGASGAAWSECAPQEPAQHSEATAPVEP